MGCLWWIQHLIDILPEFLQSFYIKPCYNGTRLYIHKSFDQCPMETKQLNHLIFIMKFSITGKMFFILKQGPQGFIHITAGMNWIKWSKRFNKTTQNLTPHLQGANSGLVQAYNSISTGWVPHTMNNQTAIWGWQQGNLPDQHALRPKEIESHGANRTTKLKEPNYSNFSVNCSCQFY